MQQHVSAIYPKAPQRKLYLHQSLQKQLRRLTYLLFLLFLFSLTSCDNGVAAQRKEGRVYPLLATIPNTSFSCRGRNAGYYADPETGCQVYHMCDTLQKQYSYLCPNYTLFNQKFMVCDHWYMVNCSSSVNFYELNDHIGEVPGSSEDSNKQSNDIQVNINRKTTVSSNEPFSKQSKSGPTSFTPKAPGSFALRPRIPTNSPTTEKTILVPIDESTKSFTPSINTFSSPKLTGPSPPQSQISSARVQNIFRTTSIPSITSGQLSTIRTQAEQTPSPAEKFFTPRQSQSFRTSLQQTPKPTLSSFTTTDAAQTLTTRVQQTPRPITAPHNISLSNPNIKPITTPSRLPSTPSTGLHQSPKPTVATPSRFFQLPNVESIFKSRSNSLVKPVPPPSVFFQPPSRDNNSDLESDTPATNSDGHHDIPFVQTPPPGSPFTMVPGVVARGSSNKFTFGSEIQKRPFSEITFNSLVFRPLVIRPRDKHRKIFTSAPASVTLDPHHTLSTSSDQDTQHSTNAVFTAPLDSKSNATSNFLSVRVPSNHLQPPPVSPGTLSIAPVLPLQQILIPPPRMKQEVLTPLEMPSQAETTKDHQSFQGFTSNRFRFPVSRSNRDFFIPSSGLSPPKEENPSLLEDTTVPKDKVAEIQNNLLHSLQQKETNMTMVFPEPRNIKATTLQINPKCPKCHPAFLRPGECTPCVLIR